MSSRISIVMPELGPTIEEGTILAWLKDVGDSAGADEPVCEIATDKVDSEVAAPAACRIDEIVVAVGETVTVGTVLAYAVEVEA
jgi:2-oxoglutarate dehydrogenase E2 component (dihydrolipoamide succinyltransferase)